MDAKLRYVEIKKLFGQYDVQWNIDKDTTVLVGQNGSGKTTILDTILEVFGKNHDDKANKELENMMQSAKLKFSDHSYISIRYGFFSKTKQRELLIQAIKSKLEQDIEKASDLELESMLKNIDNIKIGPIIARTGQGIDQNNIDVEFISTLNLSANALNNVEIGDGTDLNVLDIQIERAIINFQKLIGNDEYLNIKDKLMHVLNDFFNTTQKSITLTDVDFSIENVKNEPLRLSQLSAGERQLIYIVFKVAAAYFNEALILMDEPEISLHLEWQEKLLKNLREINDKSQMIVVTHSPAIIMDGWMDSYVDIQTILKPIKNDE